ncbi:precorrin-6y C5,15-methyltransferase (decarboxylating) subunit CbiE [Devosia sp. D6-9]|nr:precorrin-6y C5,15-methyltransferase (decarboxylating) subunit CbiE [Devosia sp. D6-9]
MTAWLHVVGVGEGGVAQLSPAARALVANAVTVLGPPRLLAGLGSSQTLVPWESPLERMIEQVKALEGTPTAILATGDPSWFGIGVTLSRFLPAEAFAITPHPSAFSLAAARLHWALQNVATLSLHGRADAALQPHILPGNRILALTTDRNTVERAAKMLVARGYEESRLIVLEELGGPRERITSALAQDIDVSTLGDFLTLAIDCVASPGAALLPPVPGLPEDAFVTDGQITKREVRAATIAKLAPYPGALLWDVGAGSGSVAVEWMRAAREARAIAFEREAQRRTIIASNALNLGVPGLEIVEGEAPDSLKGKAAPDAVFLGGDVGNRRIFEAAWAALRHGGRLVANSVTLEGERALFERQSEFGGGLVRLEISQLDTIGAHRVLRPRLPVTQWWVVKP